jgi:hypothetical protein
MADYRAQRLARIRADYERFTAHSNPMIKNNFIPPPELVQQWLGEFFGCTVSGELSDSERFLATRAAQWGANQELEACCELMDRDFMAGPSDLRAARRPKPPTLKND